MSFFGKPSGAEPRITYERIDLSVDAIAEPEAEARQHAATRLLADRQEPRSERARGAEAIMLLAADSELEGRLSSRGTVRIEGVLRGTLEAPLLLLEPGGLLQGQVTADRVRISGTLRGTVIAREIEVLRTARIDAELIYDEISVERGARVTGLHRQREAEAGLATPPPALAAQDVAQTVVPAPLPPVLVAEATPWAVAPAAPPASTASSLVAVAPVVVAPVVVASGAGLATAVTPVTLEPDTKPALEPEAGMATACTAGTTLAAAIDAELLASGAMAGTTALVAEAEAALQNLAQIAHAAAGAATALAQDGVTDLVALEVRLRATPQELLAPAE